MINLIEGTPTSTNALSSWDYALAAVQQDSSISVLYYEVSKNGFMRQTINSLVKGPNTVHSILSYRMPIMPSRQPLIRITLLDVKGHTSFTIIPLQHSSVWKDIETTIQVSENISSIQYEVLNRGNSIVCITNMSLSCFDDTSAEDYDLVKFVEQCVLYGNDADKPILRSEAT